MIRFVEDLTPALMEEYAAICGANVFGCKAMGPVLSYGLGYDFVSLWEQRDDSGRLTALLTKYYGTLTVCPSSDCNEEELRSFLPVTGYRALFGPAALLAETFEAGETGCVMTLEKGSGCTAEKNPSEDLTAVWDDDFRAFYEVLAESNPGYLSGDYSAFLTDFSHRVRHETAHSVLLREQGRPVSTTAALVVTETDVFLGAVATVPEARGNHYAATCLSALCDRFPERRVFLCCRRDKQSFYEHMGFEKTDEYLELASSQK